MPIFEAFTPAIQVDRPKASKVSYISRAATAAFLAFIFWLLHAHVPDAQTVKDSARQAHDSLLEFLNR